MLRQKLQHAPQTAWDARYPTQELLNAVAMNRVHRPKSRHAPKRDVSRAQDTSPDDSELQFVMELDNLDINF